ncbi:MAG: DUF2723 domain-containing protein [Candidatus Promineofilum sp.]|nr:DUF2723 domain-containing protein [Promineifilum sp.]
MAKPTAWGRIALLLSLLLIPLAYVLTLAQTVVYGDPTEYTFVANILGIAHPPGYAFYTLLGKLFQTLVPVGAIPWRMHLLSALSATTGALFVFGTVRAVAHVLFAPITKAGRTFPMTQWALASAVFAALTVAFGVNYWQHAIHANPHIITATFLSANLFFLTRWATDGTDNRRWLYAFAFSAGLGITHHPLTVISLPAYLLFILVARPRIWREWRVLVGAAAFGLLGLAVWLYFPLRSPMEPAFGPSTMNTLNGFLDHVLARGLSESLPFFSAADVPARAVVFWSILRLQYALPIISLALLGAAWPLFERRMPPAMTDDCPSWKLIVLYILVFLSNYAFVMSLRAQDIMAYILGMMLIIGLLAGIGLYGLLALTTIRLRLPRVAPALLAAGLFLLGPGLQLARNAPRISLRSYTEAANYVDAVFERFDGTRKHATLLNDWEHMTPLWYAQFVENRLPDGADVTPILVSTARPWLESVFATLPGGPVYLSNYRREIVDAGFRLRPDGLFYQVVEPGDPDVPSTLTPLTAGSVEPAEIVAYSLPQRDVAPGDYIPLTLAMRTPAGTADYFVPVIQVGDLSFPFTTDSHLTTPAWQPGEVIVERFDFALPHDLPDGIYPVSVGLKNLSANTEPAASYPLGDLSVTGHSNPPSNNNLLANFRQRVGLASATARRGWQRRAAIWDEPLTARPGDTVHLLLRWKALARAEEGYTVFVHLIDAANQPLVTLDYTPLGGSAPTHLWLPKWLPGQQYLDPYRLVLPGDLPPGTYYIEVGLYEMVGRRRLQMADTAGNLIGDRLILGALVVE